MAASLGHDTVATPEDEAVLNLRIARWAEDEEWAEAVAILNARIARWAEQGPLVDHPDRAATWAEYGGEG